MKEVVFLRDFSGRRRTKDCKVCRAIRLTSDAFEACFYLNYAHGEHSERRPRSVDLTQS
jgi:hypothetical protein